MLSNAFRHRTPNSVINVVLAIYSYHSDNYMHYLSSHYGTAYFACLNLCLSLYSIVLFSELFSLYVIFFLFFIMPYPFFFFFFFLNNPAPPEISPLPLPDPLPI